MKLIKPKLISGEIMTLIEEADEKIIIISPYYNINKWNKLLKTFNAVKNRKIDVEFYVRSNERESYNEVRQIGFTPIEIPNLHTKLYLNEAVAIVSSMNLNFSSDTYSLDIAYKTETQEEYNELYDYYRRHIQSHSIKNQITPQKSNQEIKVKKALIDNNSSAINVLGQAPMFKDFLIYNGSIDYLNWKQIVVDFIKIKLSCKHARQYIKDNTMYFYTNIINFGCYFASYRQKNFFTIKLECNENLYEAITKNITDLINNTGAQLTTGSIQNNFTQIFINYDCEVKSTNFDFINNTDLPIITKTISCCLYVLSFADAFVKLNSNIINIGK